MEATSVIRRPVITEKATSASSDHNRYTFEIDHRANRTDVKKAVEFIYKVRVLNVNMQNHQAADRRYKYGVIPGKITKRAIVRVHSEDKIELF
ncbi:MAG: 50S ribosomal protein L23 [Phycisphaerales bacterium]|nr:50S ribosomal protein L23 [Phycisphaerales bacterium]